MKNITDTVTQKYIFFVRSDGIILKGESEDTLQKHQRSDPNPLDSVLVREGTKKI